MSMFSRPETTESALIEAGTAPAGGAARSRRRSRISPLGIIGLSVSRHGMLIEVVVGKQIERHFPWREHHAVETFIDDREVEVAR